MLRSLFNFASPSGAGAKLSILIFHRVHARVDPLFPEEVDAVRFDALCGWLRSWFNVVPLDVAARDLREGRLCSRALAITFDDGYADNQAVAMPILLRHGLTATFFIATGYLDGGRMWNDTVIEAMRATRLDRLDLARLHPQLTSYSLSTAADRRRTADAVIGVAKYLSPVERQQLVTDVARVANAELPYDLMMRSDQVRSLRQHGMTIGAHTVTHPILTKLDAETTEREIVSSRLKLENLIQESVTTFAYPNGKPGLDYDSVAVDAVRRAGFMTAVSTAWGAASLQSDPLQLPRFTPWDRTRLRFGMRLLRNLS